MPYFIAVNPSKIAIAKITTIRVAILKKILRILFFLYSKAAKNILIAVTTRAIPAISYSLNQEPSWSKFEIEVNLTGSSIEAL